MAPGWPQLRSGLPFGPRSQASPPVDKARISLTSSEWMRKLGLREASSSAQGHQLRKRQSPHSNPALPPQSGGGGPSTTVGQHFSPVCLSFSVHGGSCCRGRSCPLSWLTSPCRCRALTPAPAGRFSFPSLRLLNRMISTCHPHYQHLSATLSAPVNSDAVAGKGLILPSGGNHVVFLELRGKAGGCARVTVGP